MNNNIRVLREKRGMTQASLAKRAGVSRVTVNRVECGKYLPDGNTILKLARAFSCSAKDLFPIFGVRLRRGMEI